MFLGMNFFSAGHGNMVALHRVVAIVDVNSEPIKRLIKTAEQSGKLITAVKGRKWRSAIILDTGQIVLSSVQSETLANRLFAGKDSISKFNVLDEGLDEDNPDLDLNKGEDLE